MTAAAAQREDPRRVWCLWVLVSADMTGAADATNALHTFERAFVAPPIPPSASEATPYFRVERLEDYLPNPDAWAELRPRVAETIAAYGRNRDAIDAAIAKASPRWRIERMPPIDRNLLRLGVTELVWLGPPQARATINGLIELAKRLGSETTAAFVNGILDQIRRDLEIPFE
ncbi:MAG: hypothetical protein H6698_03435 [Myxococcales bacterium]|nr:hypothetical protein [Myxococcales bacterium]MCB9519296.1 hypothetical protein [Myxococcales bacterium]MCB9530740.1 hypothetical protein [Myxococcales bacterium]MCB9533366.1 hypothetical protein [Myxococcales bacterium]